MLQRCSCESTWPSGAHNEPVHGLCRKRQTGNINFHAGWKLTRTKERSCQYPPPLVIVYNTIIVYSSKFPHCCCRPACHGIELQALKGPVIQAHAGEIGCNVGKLCQQKKQGKQGAPLVRWSWLHVLPASTASLMSGLVVKAKIHGSQRWLCAVSHAKSGIP